MKTSFAALCAVALLAGLSMTASAQENPSWKPGVYKGTVTDENNPNRKGGVELWLGKEMTAKLEKGAIACRPGATLPLQVAKSGGDELVLSSGGDVVRGCEKVFTLKITGDEVTGIMKGENTFRVEAKFVP